jgi:hypothetical protein
MKNTVLTFIAIFSFIYLGTSFVNFDLDCRNWHYLGRYAVILLSTILTFLKELFDVKSK